MNAVSRSYIVLRHGIRPQRFYLDEEALIDGKIQAPDGTGEQCEGCGCPLADAEAFTNAIGTRIECECGEVYRVEVRS